MKRACNFYNAVIFSVIYVYGTLFSVAETSRFSLGAETVFLGDLNASYGTEVLQIYKFRCYWMTCIENICDVLTNFL